MHHCRGIMSNMFTMCLTFVNTRDMHELLRSRTHTHTHTHCLHFIQCTFVCCEIRFVFWFFYVSQMRKSHLQIFTKCSLLNTYHQPSTVLLCVFCALLLSFHHQCHQFTYLSTDHLPFCVCNVVDVHMYVAAFWKWLSSCRAY